jgi:hypothetical protein
MHHNLDQILKSTTRRTRQYWTEDGLPEIFVGVLFLILAVYFYLQAVLPAGSLLNTLLEAGFALLVIGSVFLGRRILQFLKARLTYPRTGYVAYRQPSDRQRWVTAGVAFAMGSIVTALLVNAPASFDWMPAVSGLIVAVICLISGIRLGLPRYYLLAAASLGLGLLLAPGWLGDLPALAAYYALMGLVLCLSGGLTLRGYLRRTERLNPELADER